jgi:hypothetical protein
VLCSRAPGSRSGLLTRQFIPEPHAACRKRAADHIIWPGDYLEAAIDAAEGRPRHHRDAFEPWRPVRVFTG